MTKNPKQGGLLLHGMTEREAEMLYQEIDKVRCWLTGFSAGRYQINTPGVNVLVPGEDSLRQMQGHLKTAILRRGQ